MAGRSRSARTRTAASSTPFCPLIDGGNLRPTAREVADEAGVSLRSVYVHFDDVESLFVAASARHFEHVQGLHLPCDPTASLDQRIVDASSTRRLGIYGPAPRSAGPPCCRSRSRPPSARRWTSGAQAGRAELDTVFAPELEEVAPAERPRLRAALEVALSNSTWETLHHQSRRVGRRRACPHGRAAVPSLSAWGVAGERGRADPPAGGTTDERPPQTSAGPGEQPGPRGDRT